MSKSNIDVIINGFVSDALSEYKTVVLMDNKPFASQISDSNTIYVIRWNYDLNNNSLTIPSNCVLKFMGGSLSNGTLVGNNTKIDADKVGIFTGITVAGIWNVPEITTAWFTDAEETNKLRQVFNLCNPDILNDVTIETGTYPLAISSGWPNYVGIFIGSNTNIHLVGHIVLEGNSLERYYILDILDAENVHIDGSGILEGDVLTHTPIIRQKDGYDYAGEWGYGIRIASSKNVSVKGITVCNCWGDSICIGDPRSAEYPNPSRRVSENVEISDVEFYGSRRQGISAIHFTRCTVNRCYFHDIVGDVLIPAGPSSGIDIEPDGAKGADLISIRNCRFDNCKIGICSSDGSRLYSCKNIIIENCTISGSTNKAVKVGGYVSNVHIKHVVIDNCTGVGLNISGNTKKIFIDDVDASTTQNTLFIGKDEDESVAESTSIHIINSKFECTGTRYAAYVWASDTVFDNCIFNAVDENNGIIYKTGSTSSISRSNINVKKIDINQNCKVQIENSNIISDLITAPDSSLNCSNCVINSKQITIDGANFNDCNITANPGELDYNYGISATNSCKFFRCIIHSTISAVSASIVNCSFTFYYAPKEYLVKVSQPATRLIGNYFKYSPKNDDGPVDFILFLNANSSIVDANVFYEENINNYIIRVNDDPSWIFNTVVSNNIIRPDNSVDSSRKYPVIPLCNGPAASTRNVFLDYKTVNNSGSSRPAVLNNNVNDIGFQFFDTTLNKPIYWTGTGWVDATGTTV